MSKKCFETASREHITKHYNLICWEKLQRCTENSKEKSYSCSLLILYKTSQPAYCNPVPTGHKTPNYKARFTTSIATLVWWHWHLDTWQSSRYLAIFQILGNLLLRGYRIEKCQVIIVKSWLSVVHVLIGKSCFVLWKLLGGLQRTIYSDTLPARDNVPHQRS